MMVQANSKLDRVPTVQSTSQYFANSSMSIKFRVKFRYYSESNTFHASYVHSDWGRELWEREPAASRGRAPLGREP